MEDTIKIQKINTLNLKKENSNIAIITANTYLFEEEYYLIFFLSIYRDLI